MNLDLVEAIRQHIATRHPDIHEPQPTEVHAAMCRDCPSRCERGQEDPESQQILDSGDIEWLRDSLFTCGWRPKKLCRGYYDKVMAEIAKLEEQP